VGGVRAVPPPRPIAALGTVAADAVAALRPATRCSSAVNRERFPSRGPRGRPFRRSLSAWSASMEGNRVLHLNTRICHWGESPSGNSIALLSTA